MTTFKYALLLFSSLVIVMVVSRCTSVTKPNDGTPKAFSLEAIPRYADTGGIQKGTRMLSTPSFPDYFTCVVSTLQPADSTDHYRYDTYKINLPGDYRNDSQPIQWRTFMYGDNRAPSYAKQIGDMGGIIRVARCRIPKDKNLISWLDQAFRIYGAGSWVTEHGKNKGNATGGPSLSGWICDQWLIQQACTFDGNDNPIPGTCVETDRRCISQHYEQDPQVFPSPGGGGGSSPDPCTSCDPTEPPFTPCDNNGTPTGCAVTPPPLPTDPCDYANPPDYCSEPEDCAGVHGGTAYIDNCGACVGGTTGKTSCCASEQNIINRVIDDEGGYVNNSNDDGGATKYGITATTWHLYARDALGIDPNNISIHDITEQQARTIYKKVYWPKSNAKSISVMDGDLGILYYNLFVLTPSGAVKSLQRTLNNLGYSISIDGGMGDETLGAIHEAIQDGKLVELYNNYKNSMKAYWQQRVNENPDNSTFKAGWDNRTERFPDKTDTNKRNVNCT